MDIGRHIRITGLLPGYAVLVGNVRHDRMRPKECKIGHRHHMRKWGRAACLAAHLPGTGKILRSVIGGRKVVIYDHTPKHNKK